MASRPLGSAQPAAQGGVVARGALGLEVVIGPAVALTSSLGVLGGQCRLALQFGGGQGGLLRTLVAIAVGLLGVVTQHEPAGRVALTDADLLDPAGCRGRSGSGPAWTAPGPSPWCRRAVAPR